MSIFNNNGHVTIAENVGTITQNTNYVYQGEKPDPIYFRVKKPHPNFTGRLRELSILKNATINHQAIPGQKEQSIIVVVSGLGGIGKTQLVSRFISDNATWYKNVVWINSQDSSSIFDAFTSLAKNNNLKIFTKYDKDDVEAFKSLIEEVFNKLSKSSTLIILDNVDKTEGNKIITEILTLETPGVRPHIVITSRIQHWNHCIVIKLGAFTAEDALQFVTKKLQVDTDQVHKDAFKDKVALVETLEYFPLALAQAVAHINCKRQEGNFFINDFLEKYNSFLDSTIFQDDEHNLYKQTTVTTWRVTIDAIENVETTGVLALRILHIISYFSPDNIRRDIFYNLKSTSGEQETDMELNVKKAVRLLVNYSMVDSHTSQSVLLVHRLVQQVTKIELETNSDLNKNILRDGLHLISELELHNEFNECVDHGTSVFIAALKYEELVHEYNAFPAMILERMNHYGKYIRALDFGLEILGTFQDIIGKNGRDREAVKCLCMTISNTANSYFYMGKYLESLRLHKEVLGKQLLILKEDDPHVLVSKSNIANIYDKIGKHDEALPIHQAVYENRKAVLGENHSQTLHSLSNIAITHYNLQNYSEALRIQEVAYEKRKTALGEDHPETLDSMSCIAIALEQLGRHSEALQTHQAVLEKRNKVSGEDHPQSLFSLSIVANSFFGEGRYPEALRMYQSLFEKREKVLGEYHLDTLGTLLRIVSTHFVLGEYVEALRMCQALLEKQKIYLGDDHTDTLQSMSYIVVLYNSLGEHSMGLEIAKKVYEKQRLVSGEDHRQTIKDMSQIAYTYDCLEEHSEALLMYEAAYEKQKTVLGVDHPDTLSNESNIATMYCKLDKYVEGLRIFQGVFEKRKKALGKDHKDTLVSMTKIATTYYLLNKHAESLRVHQAVYEIQKTILAADHPDILVSMQSIADSLNKLKKYSEALEVIQAILAMQREVLGENHPDVIRSMSIIALMYIQLGERAEALQMYQTVYEKQKTVLGADHPQTLNSIASIEDLIKAN